MEPSYKSYAYLSILTSLFVVAQLSRFILNTVSRPMSQELQFGDKDCLPNPVLAGQGVLGAANCSTSNVSSEASCSALGTAMRYNTSRCVWDYSGLGLEYQILAGPAFMAVFTTAGIFIAIVADRLNRRTVIMCSMIVVTATTILTGAATTYWQLVILRMMSGAGESGLAPACSTVISSMFPESKRALALGIFNWGIYFGYGLAYAIGNFVTAANILGMGWRWPYYITGILGAIFLIPMIVFRRMGETSGIENVENNSSINDKLPKGVDSGATSSIKPDSSASLAPPSADPIFTIYGEKRARNSDVDFSKSFEHDRGRTETINGSVEEINLDGSQGRGTDDLDKAAYACKDVGKVFLKPSMIMLCIAACIRNTAGFAWAYNTQLYFLTYYPGFNLGIWITAVSIVGGAIGVAIGGLVSDRLVRHFGLRARLYVISVSQLLATPFAVCVLQLPPPYAFYCLLVAYLFAEMWFGIMFAILTEVFPAEIQSTCVAVFIFVLFNVGGNAPVVVEPLRRAVSYRTALLLMYPGNYMLSSILFFIASFFL